MGRCWTFIDDDVERSEVELDELTPTLNALAEEWSAIHDEAEEEGFRRQSRYEDGDGPEDPECPVCNRGGGSGPVEYCLILCPHCKGEGVDREEMDRQAKADRQRRANREVRQQIIEGMLERYGARMMRPYEHHNEDEQYFQYMEEGRFGDYSG